MTDNSYMTDIKRSKIHYFDILACIVFLHPLVMLQKLVQQRQVRPPLIKTIFVEKRKHCVLYIKHLLLFAAFLLFLYLFAALYLSAHKDIILSLIFLYFSHLFSFLLVIVQSYAVDRVCFDEFAEIWLFRRLLLLFKLFPVSVLNLIQNTPRSVLHLGNACI